jgi:hypothetical protein
VHGSTDSTEYLLWVKDCEEKASAASRSADGKTKEFQGNFKLMGRCGLVSALDYGKAEVQRAFPRLIL